MKDYKTPVTYIKPQHPDYVGLTLDQQVSIKASIIKKFGSIVKFSGEHKFISYGSLCNSLRGSHKICPKKLKKILAALELVETV